MTHSSNYPYLSRRYVPNFVNMRHFAIRTTSQTKRRRPEMTRKSVAGGVLSTHDVCMLEFSAYESR
jgi:hypothetical protein